MKEITSSKNEWIKAIKKLHRKKQREEMGQYLLEGFHLVEEAINYSAAVEAILVTKRGLAEWQKWIEQQETEKLTLVSDEVMKSLSDLPTPQGIMAVVNMTSIEAEEQLDLTGSWLALDQVQDPGNVGTMIRTADAAGFSGVIMGEGAADIYSTKVLRAMQGSHFHLPIIRGELLPFIQKFKAQGSAVYGTELNEAAVPYSTVSAQKNFLLIMGNEGNGVSEEVLAHTTENLYIPIKGKAESLNVAIAAGVLMFALSTE
ncbi:RNA methyltransferase [uncultured Enterococcus sp.]|uniref:TrmH family RNA methyltransferase n=1 Tax=uncultured Enterococcus sp. TaxID=167972 RepID=UPI002AA80A84|nr:RNA methyltransferase [uncultured Enterococcus sp.]